MLRTDVGLFLHTRMIAASVSALVTKGSLQGGKGSRDQASCQSQGSYRSQGFTIAQTSAFHTDIGARCCTIGRKAAQKEQTAPKPRLPSCGRIYFRFVTDALSAVLQERREVQEEEAASAEASRLLDCNSILHAVQPLSP